MAIALADILDERHIALQLKSRRQANALREIIGLLEKTGSIIPGIINHMLLNAFVVLFLCICS